MNNTMLKSAQLHNTHRVQGEVRFPVPGFLGPGQLSRLVPGMRAARPRNRGSIAGGCKPSIFSKAFTPALAHIHLPLAQSGRSMKPTTHVHIVPSLKMNEAVPSF
jgi:hypothetical protein